jgi:hypothetical protein
MIGGLVGGALIILHTHGMKIITENKKCSIWFGLITIKNSQDCMNNIVPICAHCKKNTGPDPRNPHLANGFWDGDMKIFVCWNCRDEHYAAKQKTGHSGLYTEFPAPIERKSV